jgi:hypothetical protein
VNAPNLETSERVSQRFFELVLALVRELETENDQGGLEVLPTVILTTGVMSLCRSMPGDMVMSVLDALRLKVERGDFTSPRGLEEE